MAQDLRLALFSSDLAGGGAQRTALTLAKGFARRSCRVDLVLVHPAGPLLSQLPPSLRPVALCPWWSHLPGAKKAKRKWMVAASTFPLASYLRREKPHILLSTANHVNRAALWAWLFAGKPTGLVLRISNHLSRPAIHHRFRLWQARHLYPYAQALIAVSQSVAEDVAWTLDLPRSHITTIYNPVVTPELQKKALAPLEHPWFTPSSPPVILGVGRLVAQKDFATLIRAFARLRSQRPARLMILGEGKKRAKLQSLAQELGVAQDVSLPGFVANPFPYMVRASVFVLSSAWEGLPGALIEAMACGCPVVSTDAPGGAAEILEGGTYGPLVPVGDDQALAEAMLRVLESPTDRKRLQARASLFSVEGAVEQYLQVLLGVAQRP